MTEHVDRNRAKQCVDNAVQSIDHTLVWIKRLADAFEQRGLMKETEFLVNAARALIEIQEQLKRFREVF